ncbi:hypothetical protein [Dermacoccus sp. Ellin185]|uniref:hypothetical protein n=1 Tax=Dermacoccus sp. Ellin185 TaxID=188626 RepID=UPI001111F84A|nr:hypothetical protein [Dermacoccus sp. Ellin185]
MRSPVKAANSEAAPGTTVTVLVSPLRRLERNTLRRELQLVRSALLYADRVELISATSAMLDTFEPLRGINKISPWDDVRRLPDLTLMRIFETKSVKSVRKRLASLTQLPAHDPRRTKLEAEHLPAIREALLEADALYDSALTPELDLARERGILTFANSGFNLEHQPREHKAWFADQVAACLSDPGSTLLFDDRARRVADRHAQSQALWASTQDRSKRAAVGSGLVSHLPTFPNAAMADVLRLRDDLTSERRAYRAAVRGISNELSSQAFDEPLNSDIAEYWRDVVAPAIEGMGRGAAAKTVGRATGRRLLREGLNRIATGGVLTMGISSITGLDSLLSLAAGASVSTADALVQEALSYREKDRRPELIYLSRVQRGIKGL